MVETRAPAFLATVIASTLLTLTIVSVRIGYRWKKKCLILSDYLIILAMVCFFLSETKQESVR